MSHTSELRTAIEKLVYMQKDIIDCRGVDVTEFLLYTNYAFDKYYYQKHMV